MKKLFIILIVLIYTNTKAQIIPNNGFENWINDTETSHTYLVPQGWLTEDVIYTYYSTYTVSSVVQTTQSNSGQYALLLQTAVDSMGYKIPGEIFSCNSLASSNNNFYGFPFSLRPASLQGYFKLTSVGGDAGSVYILLTKWNSINNKRDTLFSTAEVTTITPSVYTLFNIPITYSKNEYPDTASLQFSIVGFPNVTHIGTQYFIDDISFVGSVPLGIESNDKNNKINIYPNPSGNNITIASEQIIDEIKITNMLGQLIYTDKPTSQKLNLQIENSGIYFVTITSGNKSTTQKISVTN